MTALTTTHWEQWDKQEDRRLFCELNNLYLSIERGDTKVTVKTSQRLCILVGILFTPDDFQRDWWMAEFQKLPGWLDV